MTQRQLVEHEAISWHICHLTLQSWEADRFPMTKAHLIREEPSQYQWPDTGEVIWNHQPICGAPVAHWDRYCALAPEGFPKCKKCSKKPSPIGIPDAFLIEGR